MKIMDEFLHNYNLPHLNPPLPEDSETVTKMSHNC